jgi:hypothetical protein
MIPCTTKSKQPIREAWTLERLQYEHLVVLGAVLESTMASAYDSHLNSYLNFCRLHNHDVKPMEDTMSFFIVWLAHHIEPRSVDTYLSGIVSQLEPHFPRVHDVHMSLLVSRTLKGCKKHLSKPINHKQPLSNNNLALVVDTLTSSDLYDDILFVAMLVTGFKTLQRLGKLVWPDVLKHQSYQKLPLHHTLHVDHNSASYMLPYQKNSALGCSCQILLLAEEEAWINPLALFNRYISMRNQQFPYHLQIWLTTWGTTPT